MPDSAHVSDSNREAILTALTTEHSVMQGVINASVNEQQARASMFLLSASGALVAIGLMAQSANFLLFTGVVIAAVYATGLLTTFRLVDVAMESMQSEVTIAKIRHYYRTLGGPAEQLFEEPLGRWPEGKLDSAHITGELLGLLTTAASMIACVNGFIGGTGLALLVYHLASTNVAVAVLAGAIFAVAQVAIAFAYQTRRINMLVRLAKDRSLLKGEG